MEWGTILPWVGLAALLFLMFYLLPKVGMPS